MEDKKTPTRGKIWLKNQIKPYRASIILLAIMSVIVTICTLGFAVLVRYLINSASAGNKQQLLVFSVIVLVVLFLKIALRAIVSYLSEKQRAKMDRELTKKFYGGIIRSEYKDIQGYHSGELMNRLTTDIREISVDSVGLLQTIASMIVQCLGAVFALLTIDLKFTLIYIAGGLFIFFVSTLLRPKIKKCQREYLKAEDGVRSFMQEGLSSVLTLKAYSAEEKIDEKAEGFLKNSFKKRMSRNKLRTFTSVLFSIISSIGMIFAVIWCSVRVLNGYEDYGSILSIILLLMQLQQPFQSFSGIIPVFYSRLTSAERLSEIEDITKEERGEKQNSEIYHNLSSIEIENVDFGYNDEKVLKDASASIKKSEIVCITGSSGSGKSTLFKLLLDVYRPEKGNIYFVKNDGTKEKIDYKNRSIFAYVPQGNFLFSGTIRENLCFFTDEKVDDEDIKKALNVACADYVYSLPKGIETELSEGGGGLSEGQLQRLSVARAILSKRHILLLDEATSALDGESEKQMLENISKLRDRTCIIVTHRPRALEFANKIITVDGGKLTTLSKNSN